MQALSAACQLHPCLVQRYICDFVTGRDMLLLFVKHWQAVWMCWRRNEWLTTVYFTVGLKRLLQFLLFWTFVVVSFNYCQQSILCLLLFIYLEPNTCNSVSYSAESNLNAVHLFCFFFQAVFAEAVGGLGHLAPWNDARSVLKVGATRFSDGSE